MLACAAIFLGPRTRVVLTANVPVSTPLACGTCEVALTSDLDAGLIGFVPEGRAFAFYRGQGLNHEFLLRVA